MSALVAFIKGLTGWIYGAALLVALASGGTFYAYCKGVAAGRTAVQSLWDADKAIRAAAEAKAIAARVRENTLRATKQAADAAAITKAHDDEISAVRSTLAAERMRKPAFCANGRLASSADTQGAGGGAEKDPASGLLPEAVEHDIKAVILEMEEVAATGRACQEFVRASGLTQ